MKKKVFPRKSSLCVRAWCDESANLSLGNDTCQITFLAASISGLVALQEESCLTHIDFGCVFMVVGELERKPPIDS